MDEQGGSVESANSAQPGSENVVELRERAVRILVVDGSPSIVRIVRHNCERVGLSVLSATTGLEALKILEQAEVDLVSAAVMMPEISGFELLERVRQDDRCASLPFLLLNNRSPMGNDDAYFTWHTSIPGLWMLGKPFDPPFLLRVIAMMLPPYETSLRIAEGRPRWLKHRSETSS